MSDNSGSTSGRFHIRSPQNFYGGVVLIAVAVFAFWAASDLGGIRGNSFGAGTAPRLFAGLLVLFGIGVAVSGFLVDGPPLERFAIRGPVLILIAILSFALMIRPLGLVVSTFLTFLIAISASREARPVESVIAAAAMTLFCVLLFVYGLRLPFQLWPVFLNWY